MVAILDFDQNIFFFFFFFFFIYKSPQSFLLQLESIGLRVQKKRKIDFQDGISDRNDFSYFWSTSHPYASYQVSSQLAFRFRRRSEK